MQFWVKSKYLHALGNSADAEALVHIQDDFPLPLVSRLPPHFSLHPNMASTHVLSSAPFGLFCSWRVFHDHSHLLSTNESLLAIRIPVYERFSLQSGGNGKELSAYISVVVQEQHPAVYFWLLLAFVRENDSFLCSEKWFIFGAFLFRSWKTRYCFRLNFAINWTDEPVNTRVKLQMKKVKRTSFLFPMTSKTSTQQVKHSKLSWIQSLGQTFYKHFCFTRVVLFACCLC